MGKLFKKIARIAAPIAGFAFGGPMGGAAMLAASEGKHAADKNAKIQKNALRAQEEMLGEAERAANNQAELARREREDLQRQESDMLRSKRKKGKRSLMDQGDDVAATPLRRTLG